MSMQTDPASLIDMGKSACEYIALRDEVRSLKQAYKAARDQFMLAHPGREWADYVEDPAFQLSTRKSLNALHKAKRALYNAERRMERRYRRFQNGGAVA